jgi:hypothetical protein
MILLRIETQFAFENWHSFTYTATMRRTPWIIILRFVDPVIVLPTLILFWDGISF